MKMTIISRIILTLWTLFCCTCFATPVIHKQMTKSQLQSTFHVDNPDSVPKYEIVELIHQGTELVNFAAPNAVSNHRRNRRSIINNILINNTIAHHVKKDLSKTPYYSEKKSDEKNSLNSLSESNNYSDKLKKINLREIKEHNVTLNAFGEIFNLILKQTDGLFKNGTESLRMWTAQSNPNATDGVEYEEVEMETTPDEHIGEAFQDEKNMAAILMRRHLQTGDLIMEGSIGHELVIKPLPYEYNQNKDKAHHIVYKRSLQESDQLSDFAYMEPDKLENHFRRKRSFADGFNINDDLIASESQIYKSFLSTGRARKKRAAPYIIYPEILVIVDYDGYRLHGGDNVQVKRYFVSFWNGVDLRYRLLKGPRIRISIAGIIISRGRDATPYLERNRVGRDAIDSAAALTDMGKYLFRERRLPVYDIAVAITKLDMCRRNSPYGECKRGTAGFAYVGGACVVNKRLEKVNSVAIIEDTGGFSGIIVAAHEVGHLLGAVHDGSPPPSYLGGPGAERCRWEDGYIMSDLRHTERGFRWSPCTIQSFHHFLNGDTASCLHNAPHEDSALGRALPGTLLSLDAQCRRDRGTYACFKDDRVCAQLFCFDSQTGYCVAYRPAAEGSSCGNGVHCLDGRCVAAYSNVIPSYRSYNYEDDDDDDDEEDDDDDEEEDNEDDKDSLSELSPIALSEFEIETTTIKPSTIMKSFRRNSNNFPHIINTTNSTIKINTTNYTRLENYTSLVNNNPIKNITIKINKTRTTTPSTITTPVILKRPLNSINSFYYNLLKLKQNNSSIFSRYNNSSDKLKLLHIRKPYDYYLYNSNKLHLSTNSNRTNCSETSAADPPKIELNRNFHLKSSEENSPENYYLIKKQNSTTVLATKSQPTAVLASTSTTQRNYVFGGRSTPRSTSIQLIDSYFRKLSPTTATPSAESFENQHYIRSSKSGIIENTDVDNDAPLANFSTAPSYSNNYLGDNTNNLPVNISV